MAEQVLRQKPVPVIVSLTDNGQRTMDNSQWHDVQGRRLTGKPTAPGIYIADGKKIIVK